MFSKRNLGVYAGSFDPPTLGHMWMIEQGAKLFDTLIVAIGVNPEKKSMFSVDERLAMLRQSVAHLPNVRVEEYTNEYLVHFAARRGASFVLRGIRSALDYEYEHSMREFNDDIDSRAEKEKVVTVFLTPPANVAKISSSVVKGLIGPLRWREAVRRYVSKPVFDKLKEVHRAKRAVR